MVETLIPWSRGGTFVDRPQLTFRRSGGVVVDNPSSFGHCVLLRDPPAKKGPRWARLTAGERLRERRL
jgi:hypothetical protein